MIGGYMGRYLLFKSQEVTRFGELVPDLAERAFKISK